MRISVYASLAAMAILLVISGIYLFQKDSGTVAWKEVRTVAQSAPQTIWLPDGSSVQLNASSLLRYPEQFISKKREVYLDGEAYFTVAKSERHSFIVYTDKQQISVLGTEFNLLGYSSDPYTVTTLVKGKVKLETFDRETNLNSEIVLHPNQQVYFDKSLNKTTISNIDADDATSWMKGIYSFKDTPLGEITRRLEKIYGISIHISDEKDRNEEYTGKFFAHQSITDVIKILNFKGQFEYTFINDTLFFQKTRNN